MPTASSQITGTMLYWTAPSQVCVKEYWVYMRNDGDTAAVTTGDIVAKLGYGTETFFHPHTQLNETSNETFWVKAISWAGKSSSLSTPVTATVTKGLRIGNQTNYTEIGDSGQVTYVGSGVPYGCISCLANTAITTITAAGVGYKFAYFTANETSYILSADHTNNHITITKAGNYFVGCSIVAESQGGVGYTAHFRIMKNSGSAEISGLHAHRNLDGGGGDKGSINIMGIATITASTTLELWFVNDDNAGDITVSDCTLSALMIGG